MQNNNVVSLVKAKESTTSERTKELETMGFVLDGDKVVDLKSLVFAKHILSTMKILYATGERFFSYGHGKWEPFKTVVGAFAFFKQKFPSQYTVVI